MERKKVVAICGSQGRDSVNLNLIKAIDRIYSSRIDLTILGTLTLIPHFNPDLLSSPLPIEVHSFINIINEADGVLICTPEYAMGVPGTLKNAIDWTVGTVVFSEKPTVLITASSLGEKGHRAMLDTLKIIQCDIPDDQTLLISYVKTKVRDNEITDPATKWQVMRVMDNMIARMPQ